MKTLFITLVFFLIISCDNKPIAPQAKLLIFPPLCDSTELVEFNAGNSFDEKFYKETLAYRWDFNGDLIWDTEFSNQPIHIKNFLVPGVYHITVEVINPDGMAAQVSGSLTVQGRNQDESTLVDSRDSQKYSIVKINGRWWMSESLRFGSIIDPLNQEMKNNRIAERFMIEACYRPGSYSLYSWSEALDYDLISTQGICPEGWHIPSKTEWQSLNGDLPQLYLAKYLGENGLSGLNLQNGVYASMEKVSNKIWCNSTLASYWGSDNFRDDSNIFRAGHLNFLNDYSKVFGFLDQTQLEGTGGHQILSTVRCIKNLQ